MNSEIDQNKIKVALDWIKKLANGINPINGSFLPDNDIVNNVHISRCLFFVADLLKDAGHEKPSSAKQYDADFYLTPEELSQICITEKSGITMFVKEINKVIPNYMKPLTVTSVTKWLLKRGYLNEIVKEDGRKTKVPTDSGVSLGISTEQRVGSNGEFTSVVYNANAQKFILENLFKE